MFIRLMFINKNDEIVISRSPRDKIMKHSREIGRILFVILQASFNMYLNPNHYLFKLWRFFSAVAKHGWFISVSWQTLFIWSEKSFGSS